MQPPADPRTLMDFSGRTVVVTGAGRGLGAGIAQRFAAAGSATVLHYHQAKAEAFAERLRAAGSRAIAVGGDLTKRGDVEALFNRVLEEMGALDVLVNCAGIYPQSDLLTLEDEEWEQVLAVNLRSTFLCTQAAARRMAANGQGAIVNVVTIEAMHPGPRHSHYAAAKGGVAAFTRAAAQELGPMGIRVNAVSPGLIRRPGIEDDWPDGVASWLEAAPLGRLGDPEDVADACLFLASPAARWITGANLLVDGGVMSQSMF